ncbi:MAG: RluA family pseudouridine synthase [Treponema sp.]|jgi:23S rRNA pseudouridine955/2504/2580 synthase|nr:RluA family pseudouridine synthase [Treponema sp.]
MHTLPVIFETNDFIVINKPPGLAVQGGAYVHNSVDLILSSLYSPRPLLVHRLDKDTSGVLVVAKHKKAAQTFAALHTTIQKYYRAICAGNISSPFLSIDNPLLVHGKIKEAHTNCQVLASTDHYSLVSLRLGTGRMHQIRRHLAQINNPILGDRQYGNFSLNRQLKIQKLLLYAQRIIIPALDLDVMVEAPSFFAYHTHTIFLM